MACAISSGRSRTCNDSVGGIKTIYLMNYDKTLIEDTTISGGAASISGSTEVFKFDLKGDTNTFEQVGEVSRANGTAFYTQTITAVFPNIDSGSIELFETLAKGTPHAFVEDYNGNLLLAGLENGLDAQVTVGSGAAMGDLNGFTVTFTGQEKRMAPVADLNDLTVALGTIIM